MTLVCAAKFHFLVCLPMSQAYSLPWWLMGHCVRLAKLRLPCSTHCILHWVRLENGTTLWRYHLSQFTAKSNCFFFLTVVIYGSNEKHQRRHSTMVYVRGWSLVVSGFFPFFLFFFISFFYGSHHTNKHAFRVGMRDISVLLCPEWYMLWTIPGYQPLPSLNYPPPPTEKWPKLKKQL